MFEAVERVARQLDICAEDQRIPLLVRHYFSDMHEVLLSVYRALVPGGRFVLDIGDSRFYGVHVPTDQLLAELARAVGFTLDHRHHLARRHSRDKTPLLQVELVFRKRHSPAASVILANRSDRPLEERIHHFGTALPYKHPPFSRRNWGHPLHSLCSYQGKLKPSIAHWLVNLFVPERGRVIDPLGGVGTVAFEAALTGRTAVSNDKNPFAALVAAAKVDPPSMKEASSALERVITELSRTKITADDLKDAEFGLNARVADYYHPRTLEEVLRARKVFLGRRSHARGEAFVWASLLHILHGNRPYALSRTSHPITPFHPHGPARYKSLETKLKESVERALRTPLEASFRAGTGFGGDFRDLPARGLERFDAVITSPPFLGMRFDRPNWLRLWFCGWTADDFHTRSLAFLERQQTKSRDCYGEFLATCRDLLTPEGLVVMHIGSGGRSTLVDDVRTIAEQDGFVLISQVTEDVTAIEQHGLPDKGLTTRHHFLFLRPKK